MTLPTTCELLPCRRIPVILAPMTLSSPSSSPPMMAVPETLIPALFPAMLPSGRRPTKLPAIRTLETAAAHTRRPSMLVRLLVSDSPRTVVPLAHTSITAALVGRFRPSTRMRRIERPGKLPGCRPPSISTGCVICGKGVSSWINSSPLAGVLMLKLMRSVSASLLAAMMASRKLQCAALH